MMYVVSDRPNMYTVIFHRYCAACAPVGAVPRLVGGFKTRPCEGCGVDLALTWKQACTCAACGQLMRSADDRDPYWSQYMGDFRCRGCYARDIAPDPSLLATAQAAWASLKADGEVS